ncbi:MAG: hypothetical protein WC462_01060 [archaeon]
MNDKTLSKICLTITLTGMLFLALTYKPEFEETTVSNLIQKENSKGIIFGKIESIIKTGQTTIFILNDSNKVLIYYPKTIEIEENDFVKVYAENNSKEITEEKYSSKKKELMLFAYKVIKE